MKLINTVQSLGAVYWLLVSLPTSVNASVSVTEINRYWTDASSILNSLDQYQALWVKFHNCVYVFFKCFCSCFVFFYLFPIIYSLCVYTHIVFVFFNLFNTKKLIPKKKITKQLEWMCRWWQWWWRWRSRWWWKVVPESCPTFLC